MAEAIHFIQFLLFIFQLYSWWQVCAFTQYDLIYQAGSPFKLRGEYSVVNGAAMAGPHILSARDFYMKVPLTYFPQYFLEYFL